MIMLKWGFFTVLIMLVFGVYAQDFDWAKRAGGNNADDVFDNTMDLDGNILVTGYFKNTITFGEGEVQLTSAGGADMYIAKYNTDGDLIWALKAGGATGFDWSNSIAVDTDNNILVTGYFDTQMTFGEGGNTVTIDAYGDDRDIFVAKYNSDGELIWAFGEGGSENDSGQGISTDQENNVFVVGKFKGTATFDHNGTPISFSAYGGASDQDAFIAKYNADGDLQWAVQAGRAYGSDGFSSVVINPQTGITACGYTMASESVYYYDPYIANYDLSGNLIWSDFPTGISNDSFSELTQDEAGYVYVVGYFTDAMHIGNETLQLGNLDNLTNAFMAKYSPTGSVEWAYSFSGTGGPTPYGGDLGDQGKAISISPNGYLYVSGYMCGQTTFGNECHQISLDATGQYKNIFLAKFNTNADLQWVVETGGGQAQTATSMAIDQDDQVYLSGGYDQMAQIGETYLSGFDAGYGDIFLCKVLNTETHADFSSEVEIADVANNNNASDMQVSFQAALEEPTVDAYRVFVVKSEDAAAFNLEDANANSHYTLVNPSELAYYQINLPEDAKDVEGNDIEQEQFYRVFVLSIADGSIANINSLSCESNSLELIINVGLNNWEANDIQLFPNPATHTIYIHAKENFTMEVYNSLGQLIYQKDDQEGVPNSIKVSDWERGVYHFKIFSIEGKSTTYKVVLK